MKKLKLFLCIALFGAISFGAFSAYEYYTITAEKLALLGNIEALTSGETPGGGGSGGYIICRCTRAISTSSNGCYADGKGDECHSDVNPKCWEYHNMCKKSGI